MKNGENPFRQEEMESKPTASLRKKFFIGCAIGCGSLMLLSFLGCLGLFHYLLGQGPELNEHALLSPQSTFYGRGVFNLDEPGIKRFFTKFQERQRERSYRDVPEGVRTVFRGLDENREQGLEFMKQFLSVQAVLIGEQLNGTDEIFLVVTIRNAPKFWGMFIKLAQNDAENKQGAEDYNGHKIVKLQKDKEDAPFEGLALVDNHLILGSKIGMVRVAIDRVIAASKGPVPFPGSAVMKDAIKALDASKNAVAAASNNNGLIGRFLSKLKDPDKPVGALEGLEQILELPSEDIVFASADFGLESEQRASLSLLLRCKPSMDLKLLRDRLEYLLTTLENSEGVVRSGLVLQHQIEVEENRIRLNLSINQIWDWVEKEWERKDGRLQEKGAAGEAPGDNVGDTKQDDD